MELSKTRLIHNYYVDFLKSFKKFISNTYGDATESIVDGVPTVGGIKHFEFNYASKSLLHYKLYKHINFEYPTCVINITDIQSMDNSFASRFNGNVFTSEIAQTVAWNKISGEAIKVDFKWATLLMNIRINFETGADVLNYYDRLMHLPSNFMFYSYKYGSFLDVSHLIENGVGNPDDFEELYLKMEPTSSTLKYWAYYETEPLFKVNNKQKNIVNDNNEFYINLDMEVQLKIPSVVGNILHQKQLVKNLEIVIANTFNIDNPILIDTNEIYIDNKNKLNKVFVLDINDFEQIEIDGKHITRLKIPIDYKSNFENKIVSLYMCSDVTNNIPKIFNIKFGVFGIKETNIVDISMDENFIYFSSEDIIDESNWESITNLVKNIDTLSDIRLLIYNI